LSVLTANLGVMPDDRNMQWLLASQRGVLSRAQALAGATTAGGLQHRLRPGGPWQRLLPGVYLTSTGAPTPVQLQVAALLYAGPKSLITGPTALAFHGVRGAKAAAVDVLVPASSSVTSRDFVVTHRTRRMPRQWAQDLAISYTLPPRAIADTVRAPDRLSEGRTVVASGVQRSLCPVRQLAEELAGRHDARDAMFRSILAEVAAGIRSAPEAELRKLITSSGLPAPLYNPDLYLEGKFLARPDAWWPQAGVGVEVDSKEWHLSPADWQRTLQRHRRMTAAGIFVIHVTPDQLRTEPLQVTEDIAAALQRGRPARGITTRPAAA
jgi:hypothetical protein